MGAGIGGPGWSSCGCTVRYANKLCQFYTHGTNVLVGVLVVVLLCIISVFEDNSS